MVEIYALKMEGSLMAVYLLAGIILGGLVLYIVVSIRGIKKSRAEIEKMFK
jgi:hypothetical protein